MAESYYAHISEDGRVHSLREHLTLSLSSYYLRGGQEGLSCAAEFAAEFGCEEWGYLEETFNTMKTGG